MTRFRFVHHQGTRYDQIGVEKNGALWNPNGYPEADVLAAITGADARLHERRSKAAKKAAITRQRRQDRKVLEIANRILAGAHIGPRHTCAICGRGLDDSASIERGIGIRVLARRPSGDRTRADKVMIELIPVVTFGAIFVAELLTIARIR